jgi:Uma2 family endonuclease
VLAEEMNVNVYGVGSTTFRREDLDRGFESDACFYVQNEEHVRGKPKIDLNVDPPPDLVIEIDISSPSLNKLPIYAQIDLPEVWRYDGERLTIFELGGEAYAQTSRSVALPHLTGEILSGFVKESAALGSAAWLRGVRERAHAAKPG